MYVALWRTAAVFLATSLPFAAIAFAEPGAHLRQALGRANVAREASLERRTAFVSGTGLEALRGELEARGAGVSGDGELLSVTATLDLLAELSAHASVRRIELAPRLQPLLDRSADQIGALAVQQGQHLKHKWTGKGVLIGVLDTGIDLTHAAFLDKNGKSRILAVWDQDGEGPGPKGFGYGTLCERDDIVRRRCNIDDPLGHGTHVAGILLGAMAPHVGVAPDAELVVVKSTTFTDVAGAIEWMFRIATREGRPMVVNLSIGGHLGAHDGYSELERAIDKLQGPGKIVVSAAGNDGGSAIHLAATLAGEALRAELILPPSGLPTNTFADVWEMPEGSASFALELRDTDGKVLSHVALADGGAGHSDLVQIDGVVRARFSYTREAANAQGKKHHLLVLDRPQGDDVTLTDRWFLVATGTGSFDAWLSTDDYKTGSAAFATEPVGATVEGWTSGDNQKTLTIPGTAKRTITVGSYVTKNHWSSQSGRDFKLPKVEILGVSTFSSIGPTTAPDYTGDKPELIAPGQLIAGPLSASASSFSSVLALDQNFAVMQGTSMSAPHVAGVVALMLEAKSTLSPEEAKQILIETAEHDEKLDGPLPNPKSGYGRVGALAALARLDGLQKKGCAAGGSPDIVWVLIVVMSVIAAKAARVRAAARSKRKIGQEHR